MRSLSLCSKLFSFKGQNMIEGVEISSLTAEQAKLYDLINSLPCGLIQSE